MENDRFDILEAVGANTPDNRHYMLLQARDTQSGDIVWAVGDDQICAVVTADFIRNPEIQYNAVCIQEFSYEEHTPDSVGEWRPLIQELVRHTLRKYLEYDGVVCVHPQWLPEEIDIGIGREQFRSVLRQSKYVVLYENNMMEIVPYGKEEDPAAH